VILKLVAAAGLFALVTACSGEGSSPGAVAPGTNGPDHAALVAKADLDPCPSSASTGSHGSLPNVTLPCLGAGPAVHLAGLRGAPTVVNIWGSWCTPCQAETTYLSTAYDELKSRVRFVGIDTEDSSDSALDFAPHVTPPMKYPSVIDQNKKVLIGLKLFNAVPTTVFVDASGKVRHISPGPYRSTNQLLADIKRYLGVST
jgi:cytochrome c biogenesis protein CcmG/thiol:disulfide interchange protein DsbE